MQNVLTSSLNGPNVLTANVIISIVVSMDSQWLITPYTIQYKAMEGIVKLRMTFKYWPSCIKA